MAATHQLKARDLFSVKGYVCVVTGGGTGIGLMATQALAANGKLNDRIKKGIKRCETIRAWLTRQISDRSSSLHHRSEDGGPWECSKRPLSARGWRRNHSVSSGHSYNKITTLAKRQKWREQMEMWSIADRDPGRAGPCDVTSKKDIEKLVTEISKKEKYINLLSTLAHLFIKRISIDHLHQSPTPASLAQK